SPPPLGCPPPRPDTHRTHRPPRPAAAPPRAATARRPAGPRVWHVAGWSCASLRPGQGAWLHLPTIAGAVPRVKGRAPAPRTLPCPCARPIFAVRSRHGRSGGAMIVRRYGVTVQSVTPNFDSRAMTEIGFQRTNDLVMPAEEFLERHERVVGRELKAVAEGDVKDEAAQALL